MTRNSNRIITFASLAIVSSVAGSARAQSGDTRAYGSPAYRNPASWSQTGVTYPDNTWSPIPAEPSPANSPPPAAEQKKRGQEWSEHNGLFGPVRFGPVIGTGLPNILNYGVTAKLWGYLGLGLNWGQTPDMQLSFYGQATVRYREFDGYARVYPFRGGFFLGVGAGHHSVQGSLANNFQVPVPGGPQAFGYTGTGSVRSTILTPQIGYFRNFAFGLALGVDIGAQIPIKSSEITFDTTLSGQVPPAVVAQAEKPIRDTLDTIGKTPVPAINLRAGWLF